MTNKLNEEELLKHLAHMFKCYEYNFINVDWKPPEEGNQAYQQIKEMIQRSEVTEEWMAEKAKEYLNSLPVGDPSREYTDATRMKLYNLKLAKAQDFIRSLIEEIQGEK